MPESPEKDLSIQNDFFNQARKARSRVTIFLGSGKRLVGRIKAFDRFTIILDAGGGAEEMIFKHAIATISASSRPPMGEGRPGDRSFRVSDQARPGGAPASASGPAPAHVPASAEAAREETPVAAASPAGLDPGASKEPHSPR